MTRKKLTFSEVVGQYVRKTDEGLLEFSEQKSVVFLGKKSEKQLSKMVDDGFVISEIIYTKKEYVVDDEVIVANGKVVKEEQIDE